MRRARVVLLLVSAAAYAQFDAASIHESTDTGAEGGRRARVLLAPTSVALHNASLSYAIQWAWSVRFNQISGPAWLNDNRFDITGKMQTAASPDEMRARMRGLLADRFQLALRREMRPRPVYELVAEKAKLPPSAGSGSGAMRVADGSFVFHHTTMAELAEYLTDFATIDRPVIDRTALEGAFDFSLESAARGIREGDGGAVFTAISALGLKLRAARLPLEILVIDSAAKKPSAN